AVLVLTFEYGQLPWIALTLATSFATYGVIKKQVNGGAVETLTVESAALAPPFEYRPLPWIALTLATSFATYGVIKKQVNGGAVETLTVESAVLTPVALGYLAFLQVTGDLTFGHLGWAHNVLLMASGLVTVIPLLFFAAAATRLLLSTLGLLQYIAPTLQFLLGVLYFGE